MPGLISPSGTKARFTTVGTVQFSSLPLPLLSPTELKAVLNQVPSFATVFLQMRFALLGFGIFHPNHKGFISAWRVPQELYGICGG